MQKRCWLTSARQSIFSTLFSFYSRLWHATQMCGLVCARFIFFDLITSSPHEAIVSQIDDRYPLSTRIDISTQLAEKLFSRMPNVTNLVFSFHKVSGFDRMIGGRLMDLYQSQLRIFRSTSSINFSPTQINNNLTRVGFSYNSTVAYILKKVCPETLSCMIINELPAHFTWDFFARRQDKELCFPSLEYLQFKFKQVDTIGTPDSHNNSITTNDQPFRVLFPKLQTFIVMSQKSMAPDLFQNVQFSDNLCNIISLDSLHSLYQLKDTINLASLKRVLISVTYDVPQDMFYQTTNYFYGRAIVYSVSRLEIKNLSFVIQPRLIEWTILDTFITREIHIMALIELIEKSPFLRVVYVHAISLLPMMGEAEDYDWMKYLNARSSQIISVKLELLSIQAVISTFVLPEATKSYFLKYLAGRLPSLKEFRAPQFNANN